MRRLVCLGVALAALIPATALLRADDAAISSTERSKLRRLLEPYFEEPDPNKRDASQLREVDAEVRDLDAKRARGKKPSLLADVDGLCSLIHESQGFRSSRVRGLKRIDWKNPDNPFQGNGLRFQLGVGRRYTPKSPTPLILALHPKSMGAEDYVNRAFLKTKNREYQEDFLILAPEWPDPESETWGTDTPEGRGRLLMPLNYVFWHFFLDCDRIYVVGEAEGASAAMDLAMSFADRFAGVYAVGETSREDENAGVGRERRQKFAGNLTELAIHSFDAGDGEAYDKILASIIAEDGPRREPLPKKFTWTFADKSEQLAYWLLVLRERQREDDELGRISAAVKDGNVIEIETTGVDGFKIFLNDALVDLEEPVQVVINGVKQEPWDVERRFSTAVDWMMMHGDLGRVFVAEREFSVPLDKEEGGDEKPAEDDDANK